MNGGGRGLAPLHRYDPKLLIFKLASHDLLKFRISPPYHVTSIFQYHSTPKAELNHELLSGAVTYEAAKAYSNHVSLNGQPENRAKANELL